MTLSARAHASILLKVAKKTRDAARAAWPRHDDNSVKNLRLAYHACMLAARCARRAAEANGDDAKLAKQLSDAAAKLDTASDEILTRLALLEHWVKPIGKPATTAS